MLTSWKTTVLGLLTAFFAFVVFDPVYFPSWLVALSKFAAVGGLAGLGILAKDHDTTGGSRTIPVILLAVLLVTMAIPCPVAAQDLPKTILGAGVGAGSETTPSAWGIVGKQITGPLFSYSGYDAIPLPKVAGSPKFSLPRMQFSAFTGLSVRMVQISPKVGVWALGTGGIASDGNSAVFKAAAGGMFVVSFGKGWSALAGGQWTHDAQAGDGYLIRIGALFGK